MTSAEIVIEGGSAADAANLAAALAELLPESICVSVDHGLPGHGPDAAPAPAPSRAQPPVVRVGDRRGGPGGSGSGVGAPVRVHVVPPSSCVASALPDADAGAEFFVQGSRVAGHIVSRISRELGVSARTVRKLAWLAGARPMPTTAIVLAGGHGSRMGREKALLDIRGERLIDRVCRQLRPWFDHVLVSTRAEGLRVEGARTVVDRFPGSGPLAGIEAGLTASRTERNFVVAADVPDVHLPAVFGLLAALEDGDVSYLSFGASKLEPLFAGYRRRVARIARRSIEQGSLRAASLGDRCRAVTHTCDDDRWYANLNTPEELDRFLRNPSARTRRAQVRPGAGR